MLVTMNTQWYLHVLSPFTAVLSYATYHCLQPHGYRFILTRDNYRHTANIVALCICCIHIQLVTHTLRTHRTSYVFGWGTYKWHWNVAICDTAFRGIPIIFIASSHFAMNTISHAVWILCIKLTTTLRLCDTSSEHWQFCIYSVQ